MDRETEAQSRTLLGETWAEVGHDSLQSPLFCAPLPTDLPSSSVPCSPSFISPTQMGWSRRPSAEKGMTNDCRGEIIHY